ncbi:MAG: hypothetical protein HGB12_02605 [Bacteroidetes bacterium]|nr:hypothetical protein [Bacteroidota bacterium]
MNLAKRPPMADHSHSRTRFGKHFLKIINKVNKYSKALNSGKIFRCIVLTFFTFTFYLLPFTSIAQGIGINVTGDSSNSKALLDVDVAGMNPAAGMLIPRMTTTTRSTITAPIPESLFIYNTTTKCFEAYNGNVWQPVSCLCTSAPAAAGTISGTSTVCPGQNAVLYSVPAIAGATSYVWSYSGTGAFIVGSTNAVIVYFSGTATTGNLTVQGTNACGNGTVSNNYAITVNSTAPNITIQPASAATCLGTGAVSFTVTATGGLTYQWQEFIISWNNVANAGVYSNATTANLTITNPPADMNGYKYRCIVSGTCTSSTSDGVATLTVNPIPSVTNTATATSCSGTSPDITLTSNVPSNFTWTIGTNTGDITGVSPSSGTSINQTLTNPSNAMAGSVQYLVTPISTTGSCVGAAFTITVTVNPAPAVTNAPLIQSICSAGNTTVVNLTSSVSGSTFAWTASASAGISGFTTSGTSAIPVQTISNSGTTPGTVTYAITPTANSCAGTVTNYVTTVNPIPAVSSAATGSICSGVAQSYSITSNVSGATYSWARALVTGISNAAVSAQTSNPITETLINTTTAAVNAIYLITPTANGCSGSTFTYTVTVKPIPAVNSASTGSACSGVAQSYSITSNVSGATYSWARALVTGISNAAVSAQTSNPITEALNNTTTAAVNAVYLITPTANGCSGSTFTYTASVKPLPISKTYDMTSQPPTNEMTYTHTSGSIGFNGDWYATPTDQSGILVTNFSLGTFSQISVKAKIQNARDVWLNLENITLQDNAGNTVAFIESQSGSNGSDNGGKFNASNGSGTVSQAISSAWGVYYIELVASASAITFKVYNSSNTLLYTLAGNYTTGKSFSDIAKVSANIYSSSASSARMDILTINTACF